MPRPSEKTIEVVEVVNRRVLDHLRPAETTTFQAHMLPAMRSPRYPDGLWHETAAPRVSAWPSSAVSEGQEADHLDATAGYNQPPN